MQVTERTREHIALAGQIHQEQIVAGETTQNIVGSFAVPRQVIPQEIPQVQVIERTQEHIKELIGDILVPQEQFIPKTRP